METPIKITLNTIKLANGKLMIEELSVDIEHVYTIVKMGEKCHYQISADHKTHDSMPMEVGDTVICFGYYKDTPITIDGKDLYVVSPCDIEGKIENN